jgi:cyclopropane-fatty-acyl-phospholipid synthase
LLIFLLIVVPWYLARQIGGGVYTFVVVAIFSTAPVLMVFWSVSSSFSPRKTEKVKYADRPVEHYLQFHREHDRATYRGKNKIPMAIFYEKYFDGDVDFKGDALECLEYRHDWANFKFTLGVFKHFFLSFIPELLMHTRSQGRTCGLVLLEWTLIVSLDEEQVRDHYDRGDDFYSWFLGSRMIYTSGIIGDVNKEETLEQLQDNKLAVVCEKIGIQKGDRILDLGCGWGTLAKYASVYYGAHVTGVTLGRNQTAWGNNGLREVGIEESQSRILCMDYRDAPRVNGGYEKITCLEMAEHVGVRHFSSFLSQVYDMLNDDGVFFLQIAGLRKSWQYEDLIWGLFMHKYIFPGADASTPLGFVVDRLEAAGFEIKAIDTIGIHYSATLWRWYRNWLGNCDKVEAKYGKRWFRVRLSVPSCPHLCLSSVPH